MSKYQKNPKYRKYFLFADRIEKFRIKRFFLTLQHREKTSG